MKKYLLFLSLFIVGLFIAGCATQVPEALGLPGANCTSSKECQQNLVCLNNTCKIPPACRETGEACSFDADCCSGLKCSNHKCVSSIQPMVPSQPPMPTPPYQPPTQPSQPSETCSFPAGFACVSYKLHTNGSLYLKVGQGTGMTLSITGVKCTMNANLIQQGGSVIYSSDASVFISSGSMAEVADPSKAKLYVACTDEEGNILTGAGNEYHGRIYVNYTEVETGLARILVGTFSTRYEP